MEIIIVHTPTLEDYIEVVQWFLDQGMTWRSASTDINKNYWYKYRHRTCIFVDNTIAYDDKIGLMQKYGSKIINMEQFRKTSRIRVLLINKAKYDLR